MSSQFAYGQSGHQSYPQQRSNVGKAVDVAFYDSSVTTRGVILRDDLEGPTIVVRLEDGRYLVNGEYRLLTICREQKDGKPQGDTLAKLSADVMLARTREIDMAERIAALEKRLDAHTSNHGASEGFTAQVIQRLANLESGRDGAEKWIAEIEVYTKETREVTTANVNELHGQVEGFEKEMRDLAAYTRGNLTGLSHDVASCRAYVDGWVEQIKERVNIIDKNGAESHAKMLDNVKRLDRAVHRGGLVVKELADRIIKLESLTVQTTAGSGTDAPRSPEEWAASGGPVPLPQSTERPQHTADLMKVATDPDVARELASGRYFSSNAAIRLKILLTHNHFHAFTEVAIGCVQCEWCGLDLEDYQRSMLTSDMRTLCPKVPLSTDKSLANLQMWAVRHGHAFAYSAEQHTLICQNCGQRQDNYEIVESSTLDMCPKQPKGDERFVEKESSL